MAATGTIVIDFGAFPGANEAYVDVTGQGTILAGSLCDAWIRAEASPDHDLQDHTWAPCFVEICTGVPSAGVGFRIYARCVEQITGKFNLDWAWA
jgi:hypothetical protein